MKTKSITELAGVYCAATNVGIKEGTKKDDLTYIYIPNAVGSAGVFTRSHFIAPPCTHTRELLKRDVLKAVIINSGCANAATGKKGLKNAAETSRIAAKMLGLLPREVGVSSTGVIGVQLPMEKMKQGLSKLLATPLKRKGHRGAKAIMTTDLVSKEVFLSRVIDGKKVTVAGFAKGSGMIAPNMGTMLGFLVTDVALSSSALSGILKKANEATFNMISVDGDTSTNDMVLAFSTGAKKLSLNDSKIKTQFESLFLEASEILAKMIARDGEGAKKLIHMTVSGAATLKDARAIALQVINSPLVKTAIHGGDPNWGRIVAAAGRNPQLKVNPEKVDLYFGDFQVMKRGKILPFERTKLRKIFLQKDVKINLALNLGKHSATAWGCDLTKGYIDINVSYT
jgi:glutamate N-acetyltransferase/amino-acid N-acetyltransferase